MIFSSSLGKEILENFPIATTMRRLRHATTMRTRNIADVAGEQDQVFIEVDVGSTGLDQIDDLSLSKEQAQTTWMIVLTIKTRQEGAIQSCQMYQMINMMNQLWK